MSDVRTYAFDEVAVTLGGSPLEGFAEGDDAVSVGPRVRQFGLQVGADGAGVFTKNADRSAEAVLKFLQTSPSNAILTARLSAQNAGVVVPAPFGLIDMNGGDTVTSENSLIDGAARLIRGAGPNVVEWTLILHNADILTLGIGD